MNIDMLAYLAHLLFWGSIGLTRWIITRSKDHSGAGDSDPATTKSQTARYSRALLILHALAFGIMYFGVGNAVIPDQVPILFAGQRIVAALTIALGASIVCRAMLFFESWRFRAKLDEAHRLATGGRSGSSATRSTWGSTSSPWEPQSGLRHRFTGYPCSSCSSAATFVPAPKKNC